MIQVRGPSLNWCSSKWSARAIRAGLASTPGECRGITGTALLQPGVNGVIHGKKVRKKDKNWKHIFFYHQIIEGSLEVKLPTIWTDEKQSRAEAERRERLEERRVEERVRRKKMQMREKVGNSRSTVFFRWFVAPEGRKVGSLKRRVRSQLARWEMRNCTPLWREAHLQVKMCKTPGSRSTFGSWDVEKVHAVVARSTFASEHVQNTPRSDPFWELRCRKSARRCGAKHISKWKCTKHTSSGPLLEVKMSKKCTPLWRKAHVEVKMYKAHHVRTTFGGRFAWQAQGIVDLVKSEQNVRVLTWGFWCEGFVAFSTTTTTTPHYTPIHYAIQLQLQLHLHYILLHYTPLHYTTLHSITLNYTTLHYTTLHYTTLHYTTLPYPTLHYTTLHYTTLHYFPLHYVTLHYITLHYTTFHYTPRHYSTLHYTTLHWMTLHHR